MLQVNLDVVLSAFCAAASWFITINPVMSVVIKTEACRWFLRFRPLRHGNREFEGLLVKIIVTTLNIEA